MKEQYREIRKLTDSHGRPALHPYQIASQVLGLTQAQLGERIGVKQVRVADIERSPGSVSMDQLLQVLHALDARLLLGPAPKHKASQRGADW